MSCVAIFMGRYTFRAAMEPTCHMSQAWQHHQAQSALQVQPAWQVRPALAGAAGPAPCLSLLPNTSFPACTTWMNEIDQGNVGLIKWMKLWSLGSMGPPLRSINRHNRHSKSILSITKWTRFIPRLRGGPAAPPNHHIGQNWHKEPTLNRHRSKDQERPSREAVDHKAGRTSSSGRTYENGPTPSTDLTYL
jgi:hypothetical protein